MRDFSEGRLRNGFELRIEKASRINFEWRDWSEAKYVTGPAFTIRDGQLRVGQAPPVALPIDQWIQFDIAAGVGAAADGRWAMTVTAPGMVVREYRDQPLNASFGKLTWAGFTSNATTNTSFYLDNFTMGLE